MDINNRFDVKRVSEEIVPDSNSEKGVGNNDVPEPVQGHATYPAANSDFRNHRNSLAQLTREALPRLDHYRNCIQATKRPSLGELYGDATEGKVRPHFDTHKHTHTVSNNNIKNTRFKLHLRFSRWH
jgi:hypothetical protein